MSVLYTQEHTWFYTCANGRREVWQQTDMGNHWLRAPRFAQHLSPELQNLYIRLSDVRGPTCFSKRKSLAGEGKLEELGSHQCSASLVQVQSAQRIWLCKIYQTPDKIYPMRLKILQEG